MIGNYQYAFGDEAGDLGFSFERGSTRYFTIALLLTNEVDYPAIRGLRERLGLSQKAEFRFHDLSDNFRKQFLTVIQPMPFVAYVLVVSKSDLNETWRQADSSTLYALYLLELIKRIPQDYLGKTILTLDQYGSPVKTRLAVQRALKSLKQKPFKRIKMKRSKGNDFIQCADMIAGSVMRSQLQKDNRFLHLIEKKVTVWNFPDNKNPPN